MSIRIAAALLLSAASAMAETRQVYLESQDGTRINIATVELADGGDYRVDMATDPFADHFLSLWKGSTEYGINMWNGAYYKLGEDDGRLIGTLHEMDMDVLSAPPDAGNLRPLEAKHLHESDPDGHWLPRMVIE